ncbi:MAG: hypothetical protein PHD88_04490 [Firmicutes bacterium]|nr:hypothetical protein [Bacillota bacterium]MDD4264027.1 hypothetical protein [Bacillota bacterium]MDD4693650.1 hypothetical protein [Bacillota bacterium]
MEEVVFNPKTDQERNFDVKNQILKNFSSRKTLLLGFVIGILMVVIPVLIVGVVLFLPRLITYLFLVVTGGDANNEILIIQRFTKNWSGIFTGISLATLLSGIISSVNCFIRRLGYQSLKAKKFYLKGRVPFLAISLILFLILILQVDFSIFGLFFLSVIGGWLFSIPYLTYYLYLEDFYFEKFVIKEWS